MPAERQSRRALIEELYQAGLAAVEPRRAVASVLRMDDDTLIVDGDEVQASGRFVAVAIGKAAAGMARGARDVLGEAIDDGIILTKDGHLGHDVPGFRAYEAAHPVPDERGVAATQAILARANSLTAGDLLLALISGGGSALLEAPKPPLSLDDLQRTTELLLRAGAPIQDLNAVRRELSLVKGGGLRRAAGRATCISLILSDVLGNDPSVIASGPTVRRRAEPAYALGLLERYGVVSRLPAVVLESLRSGVEQQGNRVTPEQSQRDRWIVVGDNDTFVAAAADTAHERGLKTTVAWRRKEGEASALASGWVDQCEQAEEAVDVLLGGGEATVTVRGDGRGGRNTEFALAAAIELAARESDWTVASLASDGDDGASEAAGAIVDMSTAETIRRAGIDPAGALHGNDSATALGAAGALLRPGPTGTNVNDLYVAVRNGAGPSKGAAR